jgi:N-acyl-D-aspartate/D-glutamate deacylase
VKLSTLLLVVVAGCAAPETYDLVLANGRVMDPASGLDSIRHIGISAGKIAAISAEPLRGDTVVDVANQVVAPGFIDLHAHGQTTSDMELQA